MASKFKRMKSCKLSFNRVSSLKKNVRGQIKAVFMMNGFRHLDGVMQTYFYAWQREESLKETSIFLGYCIKNVNSC